MNQRAGSLDALRGYAIVTMVLSGAVASGVLPGWMHHAQVGPRSDFVFDPTVYGITWVDLVFPFFIFAMGAAFPFSLGGKYEKGTPVWRLVWDSLKRGAKLTFFAIFIQHMYPWITASPQDAHSWWLALLAFALMFPMFMRWPWPMPVWVRQGTKWVAYGVGVALLLTVSYADGREFSLSFSNIIILVLANMAIFGSLAYLFTIGKPWVRVAILPFVMAVFLGSTTEGSWVKEVMDFSPLPWLYRFYYLKYLFILIPGTLAGEYLKEWLASRSSEKRTPVEVRRTPFILLLSVGIIVFNLYGLYMRYLVLNLAGTVVLLTVLYALLRMEGNNGKYWRRLFTAGAYLLMLGLFFEAYEGGIRKDPSTFSYYFVTAGLAFMAMMAFSIMCDIYQWRKLMLPLEMSGQNPMIAYVSTQLVVMPLLHLTGLADFLPYLQHSAWLGFLQGVLLTGLAVLLTMFFTRIKWFWRT